MTTVVCDVEELRVGDMVGSNNNLVLHSVLSPSNPKCIVLTVLTPGGVKSLSYYRNHIMCRLVREGETE